MAHVPQGRRRSTAFDSITSMPARGTQQELLGEPLADEEMEEESAVDDEMAVELEESIDPLEYDDLPADLILDVSTMIPNHSDGQPTASCSILRELARVFAQLPDDMRMPAVQDSPAETRRLLVFGPRLFSFSRRHPCSIRHPRTSYYMWERRIAWGKSHADANRHRRLLALDPHRDASREADTLKWQHLSVVSDAVMSRSPAAIRDRERVLDDPLVSQAIGRIWDRATGHAARTDLMTQRQYVLFESRLYALLYDKHSLLDSLGPIEADFITDVEGYPEESGVPDAPRGVCFRAFTDSMLEFADNWTGTTAAEEYAAFLFDIVVQAFAPEWSANSDPAFQVALRRRFAPNRPPQLPTSNRTGRVFLPSSETAAAKEVLKQAVADGKAVIHAALAASSGQKSTHVPKHAPMAPSTARPPLHPRSHRLSFTDNSAPIGAFEASPRGRVDSRGDVMSTSGRGSLDGSVRQRLTEDVPLPPMSEEHLHDWDRYYGHREAALPAQVRVERNQMRLRLQKSRHAPLYVAVPQRVMTFGRGEKAVETETARLFLDRVECLKMAKETALYRKTLQDTMLAKRRAARQPAIKAKAPRFVPPLAEEAAPVPEAAVDPSAEGVPPSQTTADPVLEGTLLPITD
jgi:hypothetical protein